LARFSKDLFVDAVECGGLTWFWLEWGWIRDMSNLTYSKREGVSDFFRKWGGSWCGGVFRLVPNVGGVSGVVRWPNANANALLVAYQDFKFGVGNKGVKSFVPPDEEPGVVDEFEG
jgi:hypothetical protein